METQPQDQRAHQCGITGLFPQTAFLGVTCCEVTALHSRVLGGCNTPSMLTAPVNRLCCRLHVMFDYFIIVVATGMNEYPHPVSS